MSNIIDTRDLQERLEELESIEADLTTAKENLQEAQKELDEYERSESFEEDCDEHGILIQKVSNAENAVGEIDLDLVELAELIGLKEDIGSEWKYGVQLIPESDFEDYCQELCEDVGDLPKDLPGYIVIDWAATADNLRSDYSSTTFRGEDYLYRE